MGFPRFCLLIFALALFGCGNSPPSPTKQSEQPNEAEDRPETAAEKQAKAKLAGEWQQVDPRAPEGTADQYLDFGIGQRPQQQGNAWSVTIDDKRLTLSQRGGQYSRVYSYRLDPPRAIDLVLEHETIDDGVYKPQTHWLGIYNLDARTNHLWLNVIPKERPKNFYRQGFLLVLKQKPK